MEFQPQDVCHFGLITRHLAFCNSLLEKWAPWMDSVFPQGSELHEDSPLSHFGTMPKSQGF
ncbi:hypothetical protein Ocin01_19259 [Orchesella cincta]|uniref:Uncharacterized protein n=1 Tax=Orchesella cincta TaxID=48709 RepID=A0A1D2M391_ORCCI|nr:hypothetical protein Ocin01_19259 [Orchesella cincta]